MSERCDSYILGMCENKFLDHEMCIGLDKCELKDIIQLVESEKYEKFEDGKLFIRMKSIKDYSREIIECIDDEEITTWKEDIRYLHGKWKCITEIYKSPSVMGRKAPEINEIIEQVLGIVIESPRPKEAPSMPFLKIKNNEEPKKSEKVKKTVPAGSHNHNETSIIPRFEERLDELDRTIERIKDNLS